MTISGFALITLVLFMVHEFEEIIFCLIIIFH